MNQLDDLKQIKKIDTKLVLESIELLEDQIGKSWQEIRNFKIPAGLSQVKQIVFSGMGGSALAGDIVRSLFFKNLKIPFSIVNGYHLPGTVNEQTLYLISSYSGDTEEPLATISQAHKRKAKIFAITSGGKLRTLIKSQQVSGYIFQPIFNPSRQPRLGVGYTFGTLLAILAKLKLIPLTENEFNLALKKLKAWQCDFGVSQLVGKNQTKKLALALRERLPVIIASEFLAGNAHVFANQLNENAKTFANYFILPELNHHLLEGLILPKTNRQNFLFILLESELYFKKNQRRFQITKEILARNKIKFFSYQFVGTNSLEQILEGLSLSGYVSFYLAILNQINPASIPYVDFFKAKLKKLS